MAFTATVQWEVRTTGNDANGGGFDTSSAGTDYSQQDSPQITYTDLVIGATNTQATSAANPFTSAHVGNIVNITGGTGFTVQRAQITSVVGSTATFDKALGTAASTGGAGKLGGGLATIAAAILLPVSGNTVWIKSGTYTQTATLTFAAAATPQIYRGYATTHGDEGASPVITTATNSLKLMAMNNSGTTWVFQNVQLTHTATTRGVGIDALASSAGALTLINSKLTGFTRTIQSSFNQNNAFNQIILIGTEITSCTLEAINTDNAVYLLGGSYIHGCNTSAGTTGAVYISASGGAGALYMENSVVASNTGKGVHALGAAQIHINNSAIANNTGDGIVFDSTQIANTFSAATNSIIYGNGGWGINAGSAALTSQHWALTFRNNAYGSNTSGNRNGFAAAPGDIALTANPFTNSGSGDYSLNSTTGGGALCKGAGFPGVGPLIGTGHADIGALQSSGSGGGAATAQPTVFVLG